MRTARFVLLLSLTMIWWTMSESVQAVNCAVRILRVDYPLEVEPRQEFEVTTFLSAACNQAAIPISGRVDLTDEESGRLLSLSPFTIGYVPFAEITTVNRTVSSGANAPVAIGAWHLKLEIRLAAGGLRTLVGYAQETLEIQVAGIAGTTISSILLATSPSTQSWVRISSNSTVSNIRYDRTHKLLNFTVTGPDGSSGMAAIILAKSLINGIPIVLVDNENDTATNLSLIGNLTHYSLSFTYPHSSHLISVGGSDETGKYDLYQMITVLRPPMTTPCDLGLQIEESIITDTRKPLISP